MKFLSLIQVIAFFLWIQPLGFFIAPDQEKSACGGKRAVHMCSMMKQLRQAIDNGVEVMQSGFNSNTQGNPSGSGSSVDSELPYPDEIRHKSFNNIYLNRILIHQNPVFIPPSPVPKR